MSRKMLSLAMLLIISLQILAVSNEAEGLEIGKPCVEFSGPVIHSDQGEDWNCDDNFQNIYHPPYWMDIGSTSCQILDVDGDGYNETVETTFDNMYPGYYENISLRVRNQGTIGVRLQSVVIDGQGFFVGFHTSLDLTDDGVDDIEIRYDADFGLEIGPNTEVDTGWEIHFLSSAPEAWTLNFSMQLVFEASDESGWTQALYIESGSNMGSLTPAFYSIETPYVSEFCWDPETGYFVRCDQVDEDAWYSAPVVDVNTGLIGYERLNTLVENADNCTTTTRIATTFIYHNIGTVPQLLLRYDITGLKGDEVLLWHDPDGDHIGSLWEDMNDNGEVDEGDLEMMRLEIVDHLPVQIDPGRRNKSEIDIEIDEGFEHTVTLRVEIEVIQWNAPSDGCWSDIVRIDGSVTTGGAAGDFEISVSPPSQSVGREDSAEYTITVTSINDFESEVSLYVLASYADLGIEFYPSEVIPPPSGTIESTLTITTTPSTPIETFEIENWATGGGITKNFTVTLSVEIILEVPYQWQGNTAWCGPASLAMVLRYYGYAIHFWDVAEDLALPKNKGIYLEELGNYVLQEYPELTTWMRIYYSITDTLKEDMESLISSGNSAILWICADPTDPNRAQNSHYIVPMGYNETGFYVNDPGGTLFEYLGKTPDVDRLNRAYVEWSDLKTVICPALPPHHEGTMLIIEGSPSSPEGSLNVRHPRYAGVDIGTTTNPTSYTVIDLNRGLLWAPRDYVYDNKENLNLRYRISISNHRDFVQDYKLLVKIIGEDELIYYEAETEIPVLQRFSQHLTSDVFVDLSQTLTKAQNYIVRFILKNREGNPVDTFDTPEFFYRRKGLKINLFEVQHHMYLHVYDEEGNHVGVNYSTNLIETEINGSYYRDHGNGTIVIVIPELASTTVVVDARCTEEPVESYILTVTLTTDLGVFSETCSGNIAAGTRQTFGVQLSETGLELFMSVDVDIDPNTLNLKSNGEWITTYIELPEGYNVEDIDVSTITLNNTIPIDLDAPMQIGDYDLDGIADLMVKFHRASIVEWLGAIDYSEETARRCSETLAITGEALDVTFHGLDAIEVLHK